MPFLRGRLLSNGSSEGTKRELEGLLNELERFYERVSCCGKIDEKHIRAIHSFHRDILSILSADGGA